MKDHYKSLFIGLFLTVAISIQAQTGDLKGTWTIDLRPTPDSEGYYQDFIVSEITDNTFQGTFYGSSVQNSLINANWDKLYFAFSTKDQDHSYYHSAYLMDDKIYGITYCPGREFTAPWTGTRK